MANWNQRLMPYPLLAPWLNDYENADFGIDFPNSPVLSAKSQISLTLRVRNSSPTLIKLVNRKKAQYVVLVSCEDTFMSDTHEIADEDALVLDAREYAEDILLRPYLVTTEPLDGFAAPEHAEEWKLHKPEGFNIPRAGMLAVGDGQQVSLGSDNPESVIDLVANSLISDESFQVELGDQHIKIYLSPAAKKRVEVIRASRATNPGFKALFPGLYLHAISEALRQIPEYADSRWARTMRRALNKSGYGDIDDETLIENPLKYAQALMRNPLGDFLAAMVSADDK